MGLHRLILANEPRLLRELFRRAFNGLPDFQVVGEAAGLDGLSPMIERTGAQWVVVTLRRDGRVPEAAKLLLIEHPDLFILAISVDGSRAKMRWVDFHEEDLPDQSLCDLAETLSKVSSSTLSTSKLVTVQETD